MPLPGYPVGSKNSCTASRGCSIELWLAAARRNRFPDPPPKRGRKGEVKTVSANPAPVILNFMEEFGWTLQPQNSNLSQEATCSLPTSDTCEPNSNSAASAFTLLCIPRRRMLLFLNC